MLKILEVFKSKSKKEILAEVNRLQKEEGILKEKIKEKEEQIFNLKIKLNDSEEKLKAVLNKKKEVNQKAARAMLDGYYGETLE